MRIVFAWLLLLGKFDAYPDQSFPPANLLPTARPIHRGNDPYTEHKKWA